MMARKQCRVWWPRQLSDCKPSCDLLLFGWCMNSFNSLDIVLAHAASTLEISGNFLQHDLQEFVSHADTKMPMALQESSTFSVIGICSLKSSTQNNEMTSNQYIDSSSKNRKGRMQCLEVEGRLSAAYPGTYTCGCKMLDPSVYIPMQTLIRYGNWIQLFSRLQGSSCKEAIWIPEFDHIHQNGDMLSISGFHLIIYDLPAYGRHHYTLSSWGYSKQAATTLFRNPRWTNLFHQKLPFPDLEVVVSALNCSGAAKQLLQRRLFVKIPNTHLSLCWGRKWNPLRQRLDSYDDYAVGQHVVGSLLFTPLLLLLPTTTVFYIFFTLLSTSLILICFTIEITISVLHATPYAEILLWLARRRRFPSGISLDIICSSTSFSSPSHGLPETGDMALNSDERSFNGTQETTVSILHSQYATLGQIVLPCYARVFEKISPTFSKQLASGILSGQRIPSCLDTYLPSTLPWMQISFREYWKLCYFSIVGCSLS